MPARRRIFRDIVAAIALLALAACGPLHKSRPEAQLRDAGAHALVHGLDVPTSPGPEGCGAQALAAVLAVEAGATLVLGQAEVVAAADAAGIPVVGVPSQGPPVEPA